MSHCKAFFKAHLDNFLQLFFTGEGLDHPNSGKTFLHRDRHQDAAFLLALYRRARSPAEIADWQNAAGKEDETYDRKLPIHQEQHDDSADNGDRLFENVAAYARQCLLHVAGVVCDSRHEIAALHPIKKIHRMPHYFGEELIPNIVYDPVAYPSHVVSIAVRAEASDGHHQRNS